MTDNHESTETVGERIDRVAHELGLTMTAQFLPTALPRSRKSRTSSIAMPARKLMPRSRKVAAFFFEEAQNYGIAEGLEEFCREAGLTYQKAWDGVSGCFCCGVEMYRPADSCLEKMPTNSEREAVMSAGEMERHHAAGKSLADVIALLRRYDASNVPPLTLAPAVNEANVPVGA